MNIDRYQHQKNNFPLISSIIEGVQKGQILKNRNDSPFHFFVVNKFGFCQEFYSKFDKKFFEHIKTFVLERNYKKLRCYAPTKKFEEFLTTLDFVQKSERIQLELLNLPSNFEINNKYKIEKIDSDNLDFIDFGLDVSNRYWEGKKDFLKKSFGFVALIEGKIIGCCYAAGVGFKKAEIDIFVDENYRKENLGYALGVAFINECIKIGLTPNWDCYSNNLASLELANKLGFKEHIRYNFYNICGGSSVKRSEPK